MDSCRNANVNAEQFFDTLLSQVYRYQSNGMVMLCGDFNAQTGNLKDYIEGVDDICDRHIVDLKVNKHGDILCEFLLSSSCCILNGRKYIQNDFTSKDSSVVDYCIVPYEQFDHYTNVCVDCTWECITKCKLNGTVDPTHSVPDHNVLSWSFSIDVNNIHCSDSATQNNISTSYVKYDVSAIPEDILCSKVTQQRIEEAVAHLDSPDIAQDDVDGSYDQFLRAGDRKQYDIIPPKYNSVHQKCYPWQKEEY